MSIWKSEVTVERLGQISKDTMVDHLGIEFLEIGEDYVKASMPVDRRTRQPMGLLHGGASVALAETIGSVAAKMAVGPQESCVGLEINANHVRAVTGGQVTGIAKPLHLGSSTHVWDIRIYDNEQNLVCVSRLTMAVLKSKKAQGQAGP